MAGSYNVDTIGLGHIDRDKQDEAGLAGVALGDGIVGVKAFYYYACMVRGKFGFGDGDYVGPCGLDDFVEVKLPSLRPGEVRGVPDSYDERAAASAFRASMATATTSESSEGRAWPEGALLATGLGVGLGLGALDLREETTEA